MISFVIFESTPANPIIRLAIFKQQTALISYIGTFLHGVILWCLLYYLPLYYECVKGYSPIISGVAAFPETFTVAPASIIIGVLVSKWGKKLLPLTFNLTLALLAPVSEGPIHFHLRSSL